MNKSTEIIAVIVTYNRLELLKRAIQAIRSQTVKVKKIIVVDNASTDGTHDYLLNESQSNNDLTNLRIANNSGGAGGFHYGMELALKANPDLVWLMDDDGYPSNNCLELLLNNKTNENTILNPLVVNCNDNSRLSFGLGEKIKTVTDANSASENNLIPGIGNPFNGTLISKEIIYKIGLPKKEMFIWGDEAEYILRAKSKNINIATVVSSIFFHPESKSKYDLFLKKYVIELKPLRLAGNHYRNLGFINLKYHGLIRYIKYLIINFAYFMAKRRFSEAFFFTIYAIDGGLNFFALSPIRK